jgi:hypothetical protein
MAQSPDLKLTILRSARFTEFAQNPNKIPIRDCFGQGPIHPFQEVCDRFPNPIAALSKRFRGAVKPKKNLHRIFIKRGVLRKVAHHPIGVPGFEKPSGNMVHVGG